MKKGSSSLAQRARAASRILEAQVGTNPRIRVQRDDAFVPWDKATDDPESKNCPEWVRRVLCCAQWEVDRVQEESKNSSIKHPKIVLAVLSTAPSTSPQLETMKLADSDKSLNPVPLPAPHPSHVKQEPRSSGTIVASWAAKLGLEVLPVEPTMPGRGAIDEDDRPKRAHAPMGRGRKGSSASSSMVERPPAVMAMMEIVAQPSKTVRLLARGEKLEPDS